MISSGFLLASIIPLLCAAAPTPNSSLKPSPKPQPQPLNITTITGNAHNESALECWSVADLVVSATPGTQGALVASLAEPKALSFINIPAKFDGGLHNAPAVQWVYFTSGKAVITLPTLPDKAVVKGGANGLILAADIPAVSKQGHTTVYPSREPTVAVVMPLAGNKVPEHTVLHSGACTAHEQDISV
ncbi:hypothetical protein XPA_005784 [Xanthoria parietina]